MRSDTQKQKLAPPESNQPKDGDWIAREEKALAIRLRRKKNLVVSNASGAEIYTTAGKRYLDLTAGAHVANLGYAHPKIIEATKNQLDSLDFLAQFNGLCPLRIELAEKIKKLVPKGLTNGRLAYTNSGSESAELSIKLARYVTKRSTILTCVGAYHGGTMGALSLTIDSAQLRKGYAPFLPNIVPIPFPYPYRIPSNHGRKEIEEIRHILETNVIPEEVAAIFVEPIQAHGGVLVPPREYMQGLQLLSKEFGILLIVDEVVTGFGRTGKMFGIQHFGIEPDVMFFGKPMGAGLPLGGILGKEALMTNWTSDGPASTVAGNLLACARSLAMLNAIKEEDLLQNVSRIGDHIQNRFSELKSSLNCIGDVRGKGLLIGVELVTNKESKEPATSLANSVVEDAYREGVLMAVSGIHKNILKITPPLIVSEEQADKAVDIIAASLRTRTSKKKQS